MQENPSWLQKASYAHTGQFLNFFFLRLKCSYYVTFRTYTQTEIEWCYECSLNYLSNFKNFKPHFWLSTTLAPTGWLEQVEFFVEPGGHQPPLYVWTTKLEMLRGLILTSVHSRINIIAKATCCHTLSWTFLVENVFWSVIYVWNSPFWH